MMRRKDKDRDDTGARAERAARIHEQIERIKEGPTREREEESTTSDSVEKARRRETPRDFVHRKMRENRKKRRRSS